MPPEGVASTPQSNTDNSLCDHYLPLKKRFCRAEKRGGSRFCHTHDTPTLFAAQQVSDGIRVADDTERPRRVPCPINPNHTVYESRLQYHTKVCPDLRFVATRLPYYRANLHAFRGNVYCAGSDTQHERRTHHHLDADTLRQLIARVRQCYFTVVQPQMVLMAEEISNKGEEASTSTRKLSAKHGPQHRALLHCLQKAIAGFSRRQVQTDGAGAAVAGFLELGAGKGGLSVALQDAVLSHAFDLPGNTPTKQSSMAAVGCREPLLVVVDVDNFRRKADARVCRTRLPLIRLRLDIKDLDLAAALRDPSVRKRDRSSEHADKSISLDPRPAALNAEEHWVAMGKHLCGACTDFALACITAPNLRTEGRLSVSAVVLATCCHHRCELRHINSLESTGRNGDTVLRLPGTTYTLSPAEFAAIASMSSWAVSGACVDHESRITGVCCKRVIDALRIQYLKQSGYRAAYLCQYTQREITEENVCIVAFA
ncbi:tRNA guanosine-2-O-methyltransferase TRM13 [Trypanosoma rangeli]|uniref:tRNA:m(4)X modification enzyme TRM13 n=1 Tax=Trypanosoma rangeli TaxID=5698 RepID=A0A3R7N0X9_TRYRA|nr:tRNA guanosine-2-O-methyltransferase TRM13 [Trypanosoma rangeli]RNF11035.1 tRNA guanosine-2-O-methyltransferase TRM13 [Trypanosoma rangeli]|eukprot:RNF11035.1 tRNA guanosine-2-O-methyltransferase TRM13 [Trypanosoma rangeli]